MSGVHRSIRLNANHILLYELAINQEIEIVPKAIKLVYDTHQQVSLNTAVAYFVVVVITVREKALVDVCSRSSIYRFHKKLQNQQGNQGQWQKSHNYPIYLNKHQTLNKHQHLRPKKLILVYKYSA